MKTENRVWGRIEDRLKNIVRDLGVLKWMVGATVILNAVALLKLAS